ncbi:MAG: sigma 54-interacting transcriptional regulator [Myxococcales bacterium]|nr:sigma 54-interacting transcriptional regulator [Myxococcales bacterium]
MTSPQQTRSVEILPGSRGNRPTPQLFLTLVCDRPALPSVRISLVGVDEVVVRRAAAGAPAAAAMLEQRRLTLAVPDDWMSATHATLRRVYGSWVLQDAKAKNGSFVNGLRVDRKELADGDLLELGHTFLFFRAGLEVPPDAAAIVASDQLRPAAPAFSTLVPALDEEFRRAEAIAPSRIPVLIEGETGTGKELVASAIHALSLRRGPFLPVNCGAVAPALIHEELFGEVREAAVGAAAVAKAGLVQSAEGGTLFLDEIGDLPSVSQPVLLRMLHDGEILPHGAARPLQVDVRVIAATQRDLHSSFRADLLARLEGLRLSLPPLRERREDLGVLIGAILRERGSSGASFAADAARALLLYQWPRNVRELAKALEAALVLAKGGPIALDHLDREIARASQPRPRRAEPPPRQQPEAPPITRFQHFIDELWRRHVVRVVVAYAVAVFGALQGLDIIVTRLSLPAQWMTWFVVASLVGMPAAGILAWIFDWTARGIVRTPSVAPGEAAPPRGRQRRQRLVFAALGVLALLVAGGAVWWRNRG